MVDVDDVVVGDSSDVEMVEEVGEDHEDPVADGTDPKDNEFGVMLGSGTDPGVWEWLFVMVVNGDAVAAHNGEDANEAG